jgi:hypothetical protein
MACRSEADHGYMSGKQSVRRGVAAVSSGAIVVGAGAAVGVVSAQMSAQWSQEAALEAAAQVAADPVSDLTVPRPVVVTRIEERHVTPEPVVVHRKVYVRVPSQQRVTRVPAPRAKAAPKTSTKSAPRKQPSRTVVAPAPAAPKAVATAPKATSKTS